VLRLAVTLPYVQQCGPALYAAIFLYFVNLSVKLISPRAVIIYELQMLTDCAFNTDLYIVIKLF